MANKDKVNFDFIEKSFSDDKVIEHYLQATAKIGLWESEKIVFSKYIQLDDAILDIGCGTGRTTIGLYNLGYKSITGIDLSEKMIKKAQEIACNNKLSIQFLQGNAIDLNFEDESYDAAIFSFNGLMHIPSENNRLKALNEIWRVLQTDGYFIFTTHIDRDEVEEYRSVWEEEKDSWKNQQQDQRIHDFGDRIITHLDRELYMHYPAREEVREMIDKSKFSFVEEVVRSTMCVEETHVETFSGDCSFWIVKKKI